MFYKGQNLRLFKLRKKCTNELCLSVACALSPSFTRFLSFGRTELSPFPPSFHQRGHFMLPSSVRIRSLSAIQSFGVILCARGCTHYGMDRDTAAASAP